MSAADNTMNEHEKYMELGALAYTGALTPGEWAELQDHLQHCASCKESCRQYHILAHDGFPLLADRCNYGLDLERWNDRATRKKLFARVRTATRQLSPETNSRVPESVKSRVSSRRGATSLQWGWATLAASLIVVLVGLAGYNLGRREQANAEHARVSAEDRFEKIAAEKNSIDKLLDAQTRDLSRLQEQTSQKEEELVKLRAQLHAVEVQTTRDTDSGLTAAPPVETKQHDALSNEVRDAELAYKSLQEKIASLTTERDKALLQVAALDSSIQALTSTNRALERKASDDEEYLASDRDVRELMGARKLYIADVFDVDGRSRTRKPFGRIFYTQGKSLLFYAFDLEEHPELKSVETFQAWGRNDSNNGKPLNLGIFYMDSETNRRWVLRFDDPAKLSEINAVFVTVEPNGGSRNPTSKPFLYALLRKEANHP